MKAEGSRCYLFLCLKESEPPLVKNLLPLDQFEGGGREGDKIWDLLMFNLANICWIETTVKLPTS